MLINFPVFGLDPLEALTQWVGQNRDPPRPAPIRGAGWGGVGFGSKNINKICVEQVVPGH